MFKLKNNLFPLKFADYFVRSEDSSPNSYHLRSNVRNSNVQIAITRLRSSNKSIQIRGEKLWNDLPDDTKVISTFPCFKKMIKSHLIENHM